MMMIKAWINEVMKYELFMGVMGPNEEVQRFKMLYYASRAIMSEAL